MDLFNAQKLRDSFAHSYRKRRRSLMMYGTHPVRLTRWVYSELLRTALRTNRSLMFPSRINLNTGYLCNLKCPLCPTGRRDAYPTGQLTVAMARTLLVRLSPIGIVSLFGWAEPFLNREIFDIVKLLKANGKCVSIDSNLSIKDMRIVEKIAKCPVDLLSVSLDGADQESYSQYRVGGSFDLVVRNIRYLRASGQGPRHIRWQYIVSRKNHALVERAKRLSKELGVEICFIDIGMYNQMFYESTEEVKREWWTEDQMARLAQPPRKPARDVCGWLCNDPFIDPDGRVYPCCHAAYAPKEVVEEGYQNVFGNLHTSTLGEIWNNGLYQSARSAFTGRPSGQKDLKPICLRCKVYLERQPAGSRPQLLPFTGEQQLTPISSKSATNYEPVGVGEDAGEVL